MANEITLRINTLQTEMAELVGRRMADLGYPRDLSMMSMEAAIKLSKELVEIIEAGDFSYDSWYTYYKANTMAYIELLERLDDEAKNLHRMVEEVKSLDMTDYFETMVKPMLVRESALEDAKNELTQALFNRDCLIEMYREEDEAAAMKSEPAKLHPSIIEKAIALDAFKTEVAGFAELQQDVRKLGAEIASEAINSRDVNILEAMRLDVIAMRDFSVKVIVERMDHDTWRQAMLQVNRSAAMLKLPQGNKVLELLERMEKLDSREYYNVEIVKLFEMDPEFLRQQLDMVIADMDETIANLKAEQAK